MKNIVATGQVSGQDEAHEAQVASPVVADAPGRNAAGSISETAADFWLGLQQDWDLWHAMNGPGAAEINRLEPLVREAQL